MSSLSNRYELNQPKIVVLNNHHLNLHLPISIFKEKKVKWDANSYLKINAN